ncbi:hypothetical protein L226DRAFT_539078 [Lentinus tigrinus ALCF2SS1-7]|uniref:uncharacterized protein n=1 Tax=Lentinus tigrinus ALCF2SS1-7 TaxID=1328758 RepID=UPI00116619E0|nr:hypothetical protein L226DRAFT_539078 [Lentinus tigrinus ALCF2SS1-7]
MHHVCRECRRDYPTSDLLTDHFIKSPNHAYCELCDEHFDTFGMLYDHRDAAHIYCRACDVVFRTRKGLARHREEQHADRYCAQCERIFQNANNLREHERSSVHQARDVVCPMRGCGRSFVSKAALVLHMESGTCASGMTRAIVDKLATKLDKGGVITNPARMIGGPSSLPEKPTVTKMWATERAWNGSAYECYLCHRGYGSLPALNAHLRSPAHGEKLYRCPTRRHGCGREFRTLSAFVQHVESGSCGVRRFLVEIDQAIGQLSRNMKRLTLA